MLLRRRDARRRTENTEGADHHKLPVGKILSEPIKGDFLCLPLFGWVGLREKVNTPLVMLVVMLFPSLEDPKPRGTLQLELPIFEGVTELPVLAALERFGWDGRVWPRDPGWPEKGTPDEENLRELLKQAKLANTLVFPTGDQGALAQTVSVQRARGPFLMPPLPEPVGDLDQWKLEQLRALCKDPSIFYSVALVQ